MTGHRPRSETRRIREAIGRRLAEIRTELDGPHGADRFAIRLGIPGRSWRNYETGVAVPAEVILWVIELTSVDPMWLLHGAGPTYRKLDDSTGPYGKSVPWN